MSRRNTGMKSVRRRVRNVFKNCALNFTRFMRNINMILGLITNNKISSNRLVWVRARTIFLRNLLGVIIITRRNSVSSTLTRRRHHHLRSTQVMNFKRGGVLAITLNLLWRIMNGRF